MNGSSFTQLEIDKNKQYFAGITGLKCSCKFWGKRGGCVFHATYRIE